MPDADDRRSRRKVTAVVLLALAGLAATSCTARVALANEASGQRGTSEEVRAHSASEDARERAGDTRPEPGSSARAGEPAPLSVVQALMDAERETDLELALSLFADDAVIVNVVGDRIGAAQLPRFLELDMWLNESFDLDDAKVERNRVSWSKSITAPFYEHIGVAPVRFAFAADVRNGRIKSIVAHVPSDEIARIEGACRQQTPEPRVYGKSCSEFIERLKVESISAAAATMRSDLRVD